ncbi:MAG TPA: hypothetical protein VFJ43_17625 [Bacteroidia bacterium]|nr:hypothetical protein [Bacteroidia bacterium]
MKAEHKAILEHIEQYLEKNPSQRFGQALFNLKVNQFANPDHPAELNYLLRDIYNDEDVVILKRLLS